MIMRLGQLWAAIRVGPFEIRIGYISMLKQLVMGFGPLSNEPEARYSSTKNRNRTR